MAVGFRQSHNPRNAAVRSIPKPHRSPKGSDPIYIAKERAIIGSSLELEQNDWLRDKMTLHDAYSDRIFPIIIIVVTVVLILGGGVFYWYYTSQKPDFGAVYAQLGIQPLPTTVERQQPVQNRLAQLKS